MNRKRNAEDAELWEEAASQAYLEVTPLLKYFISLRRALYDGVEG